MNTSAMARDVDDPSHFWSTNIYADVKIAGKKRLLVTFVDPKSDAHRSVTLDPMTIKEARDFGNFLIETADRVEELAQKAAA